MLGTILAVVALLAGVLALLGVTVLGLAAVELVAVGVVALAVLALVPVVATRTGRTL